MAQVFISVDGYNFSTEHVTVLFGSVWKTLKAEVVVQAKDAGDLTLRVILNFLAVPVLQGVSNLPWAEFQESYPNCLWVKPAPVPVDPPYRDVPFLLPDGLVFVDARDRDRLLAMSDVTTGKSRLDNKVVWTCNKKKSEFRWYLLHGWGSGPTAPQALIQWPDDSGLPPVEPPDPVEPFEFNELPASADLSLLRLNENLRLILKRLV